MLCLLFLFWPEIPFSMKFGPKNQNCQFKLKISSFTNSSMQNSIVIFNFLIFNQKCSFWANLVPKIKIFSLKVNLVPKLIIIRRIQWWCLLFHFWPEIPFSGKFGQKIKIVNLSWKLVPTLIRMVIFKLNGDIYFFLFSIRNAFFEQIWSQNQNCQFKLKFCTYTNSNVHNLMVMFTFSVLTGNTLFRELWSKKS